MYRIMAKGKTKAGKSDNLVWHVTQASHAGKTFVNQHGLWSEECFAAIGKPFEKPPVFRSIVIELTEIKNFFSLVRPMVYQWRLSRDKSQ
jgi:hypothetical protein